MSLLPAPLLSLQLLRVTTFDRYIRFKLKDIHTTINVRLPACTVAAGRRIYGDIAVLDAHSVVSEQWLQAGGSSP